MVNTWKIVLATTVIFGAGVIVGGVLVSHPERAKDRQRRQSGSGLPSWHPQRKDFSPNVSKDQKPMLEVRRMNFVLSVHRELNLTPEQRDRIEKIVREGQEQTKTLWETIAPQMRKEVQDVKEKIRAELTPEQETRFEEMLKQRTPRKPDEKGESDRKHSKRDQASSNAPPTGPSPKP